MEYYKSISITNQQAIVDRYKHLISNAGTLHAMKLSRADWPWLLEQLKDDVSKVTGKTHSIRDAIIFFQVGNHQRGIHVDGNSTTNLYEKWALNIPIVNCNVATMKWFSGNYELSVYDNKIGLPSLHLDWKTEPTEVASINISNPLIVAVNKPHTVKNESSTPRCSLSIRFIPELFE